MNADLYENFDLKRYQIIFTIQGYVIKYETGEEGNASPENFNLCWMLFTWITCLMNVFN